MSSRSFCIAVLLCATSANNACGQQSSQKDNGAVLFAAGAEAWDRGDYIVAVDRLESALRATGGPDVLRKVALLTGETFVTIEVAADGTRPSWSPTGTHFTFASQTDGRQSVHVYALSDGTAEYRFSLPARSVSFGQDDKSIAYTVLREGPDLDAALAAARENNPTRSRADFLRLRSDIAAIEASFTAVRIRGLDDGADEALQTDGLSVFAIHHNPQSGLPVLVAQAKGTEEVELIEIDGAERRILARTSSASVQPLFSSDGQWLAFANGDSVISVNLASGESSSTPGESPVMSADGSAVAFLVTGRDATTVNVRRRDGTSTIVFEGDEIQNPALAPDGSHVAFQVMTREDWDIYVAPTGGGESRRLTFDIQHDLFPAFVDGRMLLGVMGEGRHRRSYVYDVATGERTRMFHNNTIRTVAPEYEWASSPAGTHVLVVSERDGDTISPERGVYLVDLTRAVGRDQVLERLEAMRTTETKLREFGDRLFAPVRDEVETVTEAVSVGRIYDYEKDLFSFGSKFITQPGNALAIDYLAEQLRSFGYEPELQWFEPRPGVESANVIATLRGSVDPELVYIVSSHFDSVERGPGADDNSSGTAALLEAARVLAGNPQPATIKFAFFTGEEAGLLGSREYVRRAVADGVRIVGALNNDMVGYANDHRLDNTIRYSNDGIRDIQHNAARLFSDMITYDARYYKSTDAHAYYDAYGDIVGGIGSYPILANPHYHQEHDVLETINHRLVAEVSRTTVATLMLLASSPARVTGADLQRSGSSAALRWDRAPESNIRGYSITHAPPRGASQSVDVTAPSVTLDGVGPGSLIEIRAVNDRGMPSWDAARVVVGQ